MQEYKRNRGVTVEFSLKALEEKGFNPLVILDIIFNEDGEKAKKEILQKISPKHRREINNLLNSILRKRENIKKLLFKYREDLFKYVLHRLSPETFSFNTTDFAIMLSKYIPIPLEKYLNDEDHLVLNAKPYRYYVSSKTLEFLDKLVGHLVEINIRGGTIKLYDYEVELKWKGLVKTLGLFGDEQTLIDYLMREHMLPEQYITLDVEKLSDTININIILPTETIIPVDISEIINPKQAKITYWSYRDNISKGTFSAEITSRIGTIYYSRDIEIDEIAYNILLVKGALSSNQRILEKIRELVDVLETEYYKYKIVIDISRPDVKYEIEAEKQKDNWSIIVRIDNEKTSVDLLKKKSSTYKTFPSFLFDKLETEHIDNDYYLLDIDEKDYVGVRVLVEEYDSFYDVLDFAEKLLKKAKSLEKEYVSRFNKSGIGEEEVLVAFLLPTSDLEMESLTGKPITTVYSIVEDIIRRVSEKDYKKIKGSNLPLSFFRERIIEMLVRLGYIRIRDDGEIVVNGKKIDKILEKLGAEKKKDTFETLILLYTPLENMPITPDIVAKLSKYKILPEEIFFKRIRTLLGEKTVLEEMLEKSREIIKHIPIASLVLKDEFEEIYRRNPIIRAIVKEYGVDILRKLTYGHSTYTVSVIEKYFPELIGNITYSKGEDDFNPVFIVNSYRIYIVKVNSIKPREGDPNIFIVERSDHEKILVQAYTVEEAYHEADKSFNEVLEEFSRVERIISGKAVTGIKILDEEEMLRIIGYRIKAIAVDSKRYEPPNDLYYRLSSMLKAYVIPVQRGLYDYITRGYGM